MNDQPTKQDLERAALNLFGALKLCQRELRKLTFKDDGITSALEAAAFALAKANGDA